MRRNIFDFCVGALAVIWLVLCWNFGAFITDVYAQDDADAPTHGHIDDEPSPWEIVFAPSGRSQAETLTFQVVVFDTGGDKYVLATKSFAVEDSSAVLESIRENPNTRRSFLDAVRFDTRIMNRPIVPSR